MTDQELKQAKKDEKAAQDHFAYQFRSAGRPTCPNKLFAMVEQYAYKTGFSFPWVGRQQKAVIDRLENQA